MERAQNNRLSETWDRLVLLLISQPREGWEPEFEELTRREIERLHPPRPLTEMPEPEHDE